MLYAALALLLAACSQQPFPALPGIPDELRPLRGVLDQLQLPDLSGVSLPGLDSLPLLQAPPGGIVYQGPTATTLAPGARLPGSDITFVGVQGEDAIFTINGQRSPRRIGDSIDFDGAWPSLPGSRYQARLRIYWFGTGAQATVRLAGVQQLLIPDIAPAPGTGPQSSVTLRFPFTDGVKADGSDTIAGTTYGYLGKYERGAQLWGVPENDYPYRAIGDSIIWAGTLRPGVGVRYDLRTLAYGYESMRVGGTVAVTLDE